MYKNTDALIDLNAKLSRDAITQKDIAKEQEKIDSNRLRFKLKEKLIANRYQNKQEFFILQQTQLVYKQDTLNTYKSKNTDKLQKQKGIFQLIRKMLVVS